MIDLIPMRRKRQALSEEAGIEVLERGTSGVLALNDSELGAPYQVPLNYGYRAQAAGWGAVSGCALNGKPRRPPVD